MFNNRFFIRNKNKFGSKRSYHYYQSNKPMVPYLNMAAAIGGIISIFGHTYEKPSDIIGAIYVTGDIIRNFCYGVLFVFSLPLTITILIWNKRGTKSDDDMPIQEN